MDQELSLPCAFAHLSECAPNIHPEKMFTKQTDSSGTFKHVGALERATYHLLPTNVEERAGCQESKWPAPGHRLQVAGSALNQY